MPPLNWGVRNGLQILRKEIITQSDRVPRLPESFWALASLRKNKWQGEEEWPALQKLPETKKLHQTDQTPSLISKQSGLEEHLEAPHLHYMKQSRETFSAFPKR